MKTIDLEPYAIMDSTVREFFPHAEARRYQASLANEVYKCLHNGEMNVVVEAPTGLGKAGPGGWPRN